MGTAHQGALVTLVERKVGFMKTLAVPNKEASGVTKAIIKMLREPDIHDVRGHRLIDRAYNLID
jgi:hypothetical protein